jgi:hypothetical protein
LGWDSGRQQLRRRYSCTRAEYCGIFIGNYVLTNEAEYAICDRPQHQNNTNQAAYFCGTVKKYLLSAQK